MFHHLFLLRWFFLLSIDFKCVLSSQCDKHFSTLICVLIWYTEVVEWKRKDAPTLKLCPVLLTVFIEVSKLHAFPSRNDEILDYMKNDLTRVIAWYHIRSKELILKSYMNFYSLRLRELRVLIPKKTIWIFQ